MKGKAVQLGGGRSEAYPAPSSSAVSAVMRGNRKRDTAPELAVRRALHARGLRYRVNALINLAAGRVRPDVVFPVERLVLFIDGCFWHGCPSHGTQPRANSAYWTSKIARNKERDLGNDALLKEAGWAVIRAWEHEPPSRVATRVQRSLRALNKQSARKAVRRPS
jgi:DNA mismatch endonuclease, patch repair protein